MRKVWKHNPDFWKMKIEQSLRPGKLHDPFSNMEGYDSLNFVVYMVVFPYISGQEMGQHPSHEGVLSIFQGLTYTFFT